MTKKYVNLVGTTSIKENRFPSSFIKEYSSIISNLRDSFDPDRGIPQNLLDSSDSYYTSCTSTALLALHHIKALTPLLTNQFHETLFHLRDHTQNPVTKSKNPEDALAWDISESASVWATSLALWALLKTEYQGERIEEVKNALLWLIEQQNKNDRDRLG